MKKTILLLVTILCLNGCSEEQETSLELSQQEVVFPVVVEIDGRSYYPADQIQCNQRKYRVSKEIIGPLSKFEQVDISNCQKVIGYQPKAYARLFNLLEWVRQHIPTEELVDAHEKALRIQDARY